MPGVCLTDERQVNGTTANAGAQGIDPGRLHRAIWLATERMGPGRYEVTGDRDSHLVDLTAGGCDCRDAAYRLAICKHELAARLREGDEVVIRALRLIVPEPVGSSRRAVRPSNRRSGRGTLGVSEAITARTERG